MKVIVHKDRVLLKPIPLQTQNVLDGTSTEDDPTHFEVIEKGPLVGDEIEVGDIAIKHQSTGIDFFFQKERRIVVREDDIHITLRNQ